MGNVLTKLTDKIDALTAEVNSLNTRLTAALAEARELREKLKASDEAHSATENARCELLAQVRKLKEQIANIHRAEQANREMAKPGAA